MTLFGVTSARIDEEGWDWTGGGSQISADMNLAVFTFEHQQRGGREKPSEDYALLLVAPSHVCFFFDLLTIAMVVRKDF